MEQDKTFFIIEEKDGSHTAVLKFANFETKEEAECVVNNIIHELGYINRGVIYPTYH
tara:strand:- start:386 stop:556 length:171 start_codon:yes stop_codon:yes gene_type:complete